MKRNIMKLISSFLILYFSLWIILRRMKRLVIPSGEEIGVRSIIIVKLIKTV
jgi:ABC-type nickel/cobalt efflux system permease component RcnA